MFSTDVYGVTVSQIAYARRLCQDTDGDLGSYRGDLWDAVLHACGYIILEFMAAYPRTARYTQLYTRKDFEALWKGREQGCPYWDDNEWPAAHQPNRDIIDLSANQEYLCVCGLRCVRWVVNNNDKYCYFSRYYANSSASSGSDVDIDITYDDDNYDEVEERGEEAIILQGTQDCSSSHGSNEPGSPEDTAMEEFFNLDEL